MYVGCMFICGLVAQKCFKFNNCKKKFFSKLDDSGMVLDFYYFVKFSCYIGPKQAKPLWEARLTISQVFLQAWLFSI